MSGSSSPPHQMTPNPPKRARVTVLPSTSSESSQALSTPHTAAAETVSDSKPLHRGKYDDLKLLKAVASFRLRNGFTPTSPRFTPDFLKEVKDFVPMGLSEKKLLCRLCNLRSKFWKIPVPGRDCPDYDRSFYELGLKAWGSHRPKDKDNASGFVKRNGKTDGMKKNIKGEESENEEDEDANGETKSMEGDKDEENELLEDGCVSLLGKDEAGSPYKYLKHALEELWIAKNLDLNVLQLALQKVDPVQAKHLDEQFMEIAKDELKLKIEKNRLSNYIINVLYTGLKRC